MILIFAIKIAIDLLFRFEFNDIPASTNVDIAQQASAGENRHHER